MPKRIILCLDGTWGRADGRRHTNVVALMRAIAPVGIDGRQQVVYYDKGVGTGGAGDRIVGGLTGRGLGTNVRDAYLFLGNNWEPGDEVFVFGFSRGAFTARSLVGFISACGLLGRHSMRNLPEAWRRYRMRPERRPSSQAEGLDAGEARRQQAMADFGARNVRIACLGVWDTVGALGIPVRWIDPLGFLKRRHAFHDTALSSIVDHAFHALAIDEKRGAFGPTLWQRPADEPLPDGQIVEQVWFAGVHSDVGGGYDHAPLAVLSLRWMMERVAARTGLTFRSPAEVRKQQVQERAVGEAQAVELADDEVVDALALQHESRTLLYAMSRVLPYQRVIAGRDGWTRRFLPSRNRPRKGCVFVNEALHRSVLERWDQEVRAGRRTIRYRPRNVAAAKDEAPVALPLPKRARVR